jgi:putative tryptophan/tyrosine transport system substrate-binding protein
MHRRRFLEFAVACAASPLTAVSATGSRIVVFVGTTDLRAREIRRAWAEWLAADELADTRDVTVEVVNAGVKDDPAHEERLARQVVESGPAVICIPGGWVELFRGLTRQIPLVFRLVNDPVSNGWVHSLSHPGGNITGASSPHHALLEKKLELLKELSGGVPRVANLVRSDGLSQRYRDDVRGSAARLGITVSHVSLTIEMMNSPGGAGILEAARQARADAFNVNMIDDVIPSSLLDHFLQSAIPATYDEVMTVHRGGLAYMGEDAMGPHRRSYALAVRILRGQKAEDIPIDQQAQFETAVNLRTARAMRLPIPGSVRLRATYLVS